LQPNLYCKRHLGKQILHVLSFCANQEKRHPVLLHSCGQRQTLRLLIGFNSSSLQEAMIELDESLDEEQPKRVIQIRASLKRAMGVGGTN
jgi:hypothetical protein